jgi:hypothetical protein
MNQRKDEYHSTREDWKHQSYEDDKHMHRRGMIDKVGFKCNKCSK